MEFIVDIDPKALQEVQEAVDYYEDQQPGLGVRFEATLNGYLTKLETNPFYRVRYENVHCLPMREFPYMLHFTVDENRMTVTVRSVMHTSKSPENWKKR